MGCHGTKVLVQEREVIGLLKGAFRGRDEQITLRPLVLRLRRITLDDAAGIPAVEQLPAR